MMTTAQTAPSSTNPAIRVRVVASDDAAPLAAFARRTFTATYARGGTGAVATSRLEDVDAYASASFTLERQRAELDDPATVTFVAEDATTATWVGYAQLRLRPHTDAPTPPTCAGSHPRELARLYVDAAWHGRGVASTLMDAVQARAAAEPGSADPLWLAVYQANVRAIAFYRHRGFVVVGATMFTMGHERQHDWLMVWRG